jgi:hypothetical protein
VVSTELEAFSDFFHLEWTSDERWILFSGRRTDDEDLDIYALDQVDGRVEPVVSTPGDDTLPAFAGRVPSSGGD